MNVHKVSLDVVRVVSTEQIGGNTGNSLKLPVVSALANLCRAYGSMLSKAEKLFQHHTILYRAMINQIATDHCHVRPPVLTDHAFSAEGPTGTFQYSWICHQRPPVSTDHIFATNGVVCQDRFYCILLPFVQWRRVSVGSLAFPPVVSPPSSWFSSQPGKQTHWRRNFTKCGTDWCGSEQPYHYTTRPQCSYFANIIGFIEHQVVYILLCLI